MRHLAVACSGGGHLKELLLFLERMPEPIDRITCFTFESGLARGLHAVAGTSIRVIPVPYAAPRQTLPLAKAGRIMWQELTAAPPEMVLSTGAGLAVPLFLIGRRLRAQCVYIESATRLAAPSLTGAIAERFPFVETYCQYDTWSRTGWQVIGSVFDAFESFDRPRVRTPRSAVVSVGSTESYGFERLLIAAKRVLPEGCEVLWQVGATKISGTGIAGRPTVPGDEFEAALGDADVVIAHAGVGIALSCLEAGVIPILVPRQAVHGEHVDDHQSLVAGELVRRGLAVTASPVDLSTHHLAAAAARGARTSSSVPTLPLDSSGAPAAPTGG
jgi:UDP-N-acetylglucosamine--N-acetylmuramyl-(pentapeptide) pyrophosphoryl-undecaprenol N-acetylglucosamine transferase